MKEFNFPLLNADQIEVKVKQVTAKGAVLLLYKTARTDMELLDAVVGPMNWAVDYREIKGNLYCGIGITEDGEHWVWKWDCGIESRADGDGNEKKGEASDAFKRAGFKWGVGRELYTSPFTFAKLETVPSEKGRGYELKDKFARFKVAEIAYEGRTVSRLVITDNHGQVVFSYGKGAMPVGSAEAAQEAGAKKLEEIKGKLDKAGNGAVKGAAGAFTCERCGKPIKAVKFGDGNVMLVSQILETSRKDLNGNYCYKCYMEVMEAKDGTGN